MKRLLVVCEAAADFRAARIVADRVLAEEIEWLRDQDLAHFRRWVGLDDANEFSVWKGLREAIEQRGLRVPRIFGLFDGSPGAPDARVARFALLAFASLDPKPDAVVLVRDADVQPERRKGLSQARSEMGPAAPFAIVIGVADPNREAWVLTAFRPETPAEAGRLADLRKSLGFDPTQEPHRLRGRNDDRDIKRVVDSLTADDSSREDAALAEHDLRTRGSSTTKQGPSVGLAEFVEELRTRLVPVFAGPSAR